MPRKSTKPPKKPPRKPPAVATSGGDDDYEKRKKDQSRRDKAESESGRDCGTTPPIADIDRRDRCRKSLREFCETYNPEGFQLKWSHDHLLTLDRIEEAARHGALYAIAKPRGFGKTSICRFGCLWALANNLCRYAFLIGANDSKASDSLDAIKIYIRFLPLFQLDYPEISHPINALKGIAQSAKGQLCLGKPTLVEWSNERIIFPTVPPPSNWPREWKLRSDGMVPTSGSVFSMSGLTGSGIRGSLLTLSTGESIRPDLVMIDDPQTNESSGSETQNITRMKLISQDVLGMAGPGKTISAVMPCTVITRNDFIDQILDRSKHPMWRGERTGILTALPKNMVAWKDYFEVYGRCAQLDPPDYTESNTYYIDHQEKLEEGTEATWPERKLPEEVSAIQSAMHLYFRDPVGFMAEYMNTPLDEAVESAESLTPEEVLRKVCNIPRGAVPRNSSRLTAFIDVGVNVLWWMVCAWDERFGGTIIGYGVYPEQKQAYFRKSAPTQSLGQIHAGKSQEAAVYAGLTAVVENILGKSFRQEETGIELKVEKLLIDANYGDLTDLVYDFIRRSPHTAVITPSHGKYIGVAMNPMASWVIDQGKGERRGLNWVIKSAEGRHGRHVTFDTNFWKSFTAERIRTPEGATGCLRIHSPGPAGHTLLADHFGAEYPVRVQRDTQERIINEWKDKPNRDNDWWDCLVGCGVAASVLGINWSASDTPTLKPRIISMNDERNAAMAAQAARGKVTKL